jgi:tetratricopeptide (TPR) repeat protein
LAADLDVEFSLLGDTAHFEFTGRDHWNYDLEKKSEKNQSWIEMRVPRLSEKAIFRLKAVQGGPIRSVQVDRNGPDSTDIVRVQLSVKDIESFDYLTDQPSRLIVDLYPQKPKAVQAPSPADKKNEEAAQEAGTSKKTTNTAQSAKKAKADRKIATTDILIVKNEALENLQKSMKTDAGQSGIFDGSDPDFSRFSIQDYEVREDAVIQSREKDYIDFPMLHQEPDELQVLNSKRPFYEIEPIKSDDAKAMDENKMARLLLTLFNNKRYHVFLKTVDWFYEKFPESKYDEIIRFMWADTHYALYQEAKNLKDFDLAMFRYREALHKYPESQLAERTMLLMGYASLDRGDYLGTLRMFQTHLTKRPASANRDLARLAIAEAFLKLNQYDDAEKAYEDIEKDALRPEDKVRAAYLKGDVFFQKKDDLKAIATYQAALKKYPNEQKEYPNALYNQAAASFRQGDYRASLNQYREFLQKFPSHPYAGYAMTRVGELLDILGADASRVNGAYLETFFRYGDSPSAVVARLRLLGARIKGMKPKEVEKAVSDIMALAEKSHLPKIDQFATLLVADGFTSRGQYDDAIELLVKFYQDHPTSADTQRLKNKIVRNINEKIREQVVTGKFIDALKTHNHYADNWLKSSDRIDTKYWVGRAFEQAGVFKESEKLYRDTLNKIYALKGTKAGQERNVFERLPSADELHLRLGSVQFQQGRWNQAYEQLKEIQKPELLSERDQVERVQMVAALLDKKGDSEFSLRYLAELIKTWKGVPALVAGPHFDAGEIQMKLGKKEDALQSFQRVDELMKDSGQVPVSLHARSLERIVQIYLNEKKTDKAMPVLEKLLKTYEKSMPLASWRYKMGQLYFDKGEIQKAAEVWNDLKGEKTDFWYKLAQEQLKGSEWAGDYKKYIQRIPAMSEKE